MSVGPTSAGDAAASGPRASGGGGGWRGERAGLAAAFLVSGRRVIGRSGLGTAAPGTTSMSNRAATWGSRGASRRTVATSSSLRCSGAAVGATSERTGENAAASSTADHRSGPSPGCSDAVVASPSRAARAPGNGTPAFGGTEDRRSARTTRPTSSAASTSASHRVSSSSCLVTSAALRAVASSRGRLVAGHHRVVGGGHDAAQVAQVEVLHLTLGRVGAVEPVGDAQPGDEVLGHSHHGGLRHLRLALGSQPGVVLAQALAHGSDALQRQLGDRPLLLRQGLEDVGAVLLAGPQALRLGALRNLGRWREVRPLTSAVLATRPPLAGGALAVAGGAVAGGALAAAPPGPVTLAALAAVRTVGTVGTLAAPLAALVARAVTPRTARALVAAAARRALLDHRLEAVLRRQQLEHVGAVRLLLARDHREDADAVDVLLRLDAQLVADRRSRREDRTVENAARLPGPGGAPGP